MKFLKILLFPFAILYGCLTWVRNRLYDAHLLSSTSFDIPLIVVGNLSMGGTGKSPHIEYLIRLLKNEFKITTLSLGYGRNSEGFILAQDTSTANEIGDEPLQFKTKFPEIKVAVDAKRVNGINKLLQYPPAPNVILLDDAFQHRAVKAGFYVLLTDYQKLYVNDFMFPTGTLREFRSGAKRADIIIVTKCPVNLSEEKKKDIINRLHPSPNQKIYFSFIKYGELVQVKPSTNNNNLINQINILNKDISILLLTGIANPKPIESHLEGKVKSIVPATFSDHHQFSEKDMMAILNLFNTIASENKILVTTEKDWMRLKSSVHLNLLSNLPLFYLPIEIDFNNNDKQQFNNQILKYVRGN